jgi:uncharacterized protein (DUF362 family)
MSPDPRSRPDRVSRRAFIATASVFAATAWGGRRPYDQNQFVVPAASAVGLFPASSYAADFSDIVFRGFGELGVRLEGQRVLLKPNMVEYEAGTAINTHPNVVAGAAIACYRAGAAQVIVGEGPGHRRDIEYLLTTTGLQDQLREQRIQFVDLNHDDVRMVAMRSWYTGMREIALPAAILDADFVISMPKLKTHHWAGITCSMKNLFGTVPGAVYGWPKNILHAHGIPNSIVDLVATIRPQLAIVDAVTAMEGDGPIMGKPRHMGFIGMSRDLVALDATCARIIGLDPDKIDYLVQAGEFLGVSNANRITHRGEPMSRYATRFDVVPALAHLHST